MSSGPWLKENSRKKSRFIEAQIVAILKELDAGAAATGVARRNGIHANTIRPWRDKYAGLETSDLTRLKQLQAESARRNRVDRAADHSTEPPRVLGKASVQAVTVEEASKPPATSSRERHFISRA